MLSSEFGERQENETEVDMKPWVSVGGDLPPGTLAAPADGSGHHHWSVGAPGIQWTESFMLLNTQQYTAQPRQRYVAPKDTVPRQRNLI